MKTLKLIVPVLIALTLVACGGSTFEWFPSVNDTTPPVLTVSSGGAILSASSSNSLSLPATNITFSANEPATIYYTTNGTDPTTSTATSVTIASANGSATGPVISLTNTILKLLGKDLIGNVSTVQSYTIVAAP